MYLVQISTRSQQLVNRLFNMIRRLLDETRLLEELLEDGVSTERVSL
jgi:hypothetical protein